MGKTLWNVLLADLLSLLVEIMPFLLSGVNIVSSFLVSPHTPLRVLSFPVNFKLKISFYKVNIKQNISKKEKHTFTDFFHNVKLELAMHVWKLEESSNFWHCAGLHVWLSCWISKTLSGIHTLKHYESHRKWGTSKDYQNQWIEKLQAEGRSMGALRGRCLKLPGVQTLGQ